MTERAYSAVSRSHGNQPCVSCPWRRERTAAEIPGFCIVKARALSNTVGHGDDFRPIMACHYSDEGGERPCLGYVAVVGWSNLSLRMMAITEKIDISAVMEASEGLDLHESFGEMLAKLERTVAP